MQRATCATGSRRWSNSPSGDASRCWALVTLGSRLARPEPHSNASSARRARRAGPPGLDDGGGRRVHGGRPGQVQPRHYSRCLALDPGGRWANCRPARAPKSSSATCSSPLYPGHHGRMRRASYGVSRRRIASREGDEDAAKDKGISGERAPRRRRHRYPEAKGCRRFGWALLLVTAERRSKHCQQESRR